MIQNPFLICTARVWLYPPLAQERRPLLESEPRCPRGFPAGRQPNPPPSSKSQLLMWKAPGRGANSPPSILGCSDSRRSAQTQVFLTSLPCALLEMHPTGSARGVAPSPSQTCHGPNPQRDQHVTSSWKLPTAQQYLFPRVAPDIFFINLSPPRQEVAPAPDGFTWWLPRGAVAEGPRGLSLSIRAPRCPPPTRAPRDAPAQPKPRRRRGNAWDE